MAENLIPGGTTSINDLGSVDKGVYAAFPAGTPKYHAGSGPESVYRQARMYVTVPAPLYAAYRAAVPDRARALLDVLCVTSGKGSIGFIDMLISQVSESFNEKVQVTEVISDAHIAYFYGQRAVTIPFSGTLLNTQQDNWYTAFYVLYADLLRGTKTTTHGADVTIKYDDKRVVGSIVAMNTGLNSAMETAVPFGLQMLVREIIIDRPVRATFRSAQLALDDGTTPGAQPTNTVLLSSAQDTYRAAAQAASAAIAAFVRPGANTAELSQAYGVDLEAAFASAADSINAGAAALVASGAALAQTVATPPVLGESNLDRTRSIPNDF